MRKIKRAIIVLSLAAVPFMAPGPQGGVTLAADPPGLARAQAIVVAKKPIIVVKKPIRVKPKPAPAPLLGVGLPAFALAGFALAGYRFWRRRSPKE